MKYTPTGSYVAVEVAELAIFAVGTLWMMWVIRSYKLKKPLDDEQERTVFKFIVILTNTFWMTFCNSIQISVTNYRIQIFVFRALVDVNF